MNAVVALCHFCEAHGPRIVFCCQPFHDDHEENFLPAAIFGENSQRSLTASSSSSASNADEKRRKVFYGKFDDYFDVTLNQDGGGGGNKIGGESCNACRSMKSTRPGFLSNDHENRISYLGSQFPYHPEVFTIVRQACVRSLSCEVCPGREGPIFFGDEQYGYCLCHPFILKDSKARGFQRWYSYCIVSMDKFLLLNFYELLSSSLKLLVEFMQTTAKKIFEKEQTRGTENLPQIAASGRLGWLPSGFMRERAGSSSSGVARPLTELTGDPEIFGKLQRYFVWILQLPSGYVSEQVLEGLPSQDDLVRIESGFDDLSNGTENSSEYDDHGRELLDSTSGRDRALRNLRFLFQVFGSEAFKILAYNIVIGNQIVVKSESEKISELVLDALQVLLPVGCCKVAYASEKYLEPWRCNLLALPYAAQLPDPIDGGPQFVVVSAKFCQDSCSNLSSAEEPANQIVRDRLLADQRQQLISVPANRNFESSLGRCSFRLHYVGGAPDDYPSLLDRIMLILADANLHIHSLDRCLTTLKEEWLNKSKLLFQLTKGQNHLDENRCRELFAKITKCKKPADELVVKFWQAGLSRQYKNFVLNRVSASHGRLQDK